jgi:hypothetical protein
VVPFHQLHQPFHLREASYQYQKKHYDICIPIVSVEFKSRYKQASL